jgi:hypothetical protein
MWKKLSDAPVTPPESALHRVPESMGSLGESLMEALRDPQSEKAKFASAPQKSSAEGDDQPSTAATMATYAAAMNEFTRNATAFIGYLPLLSKARDAYEQGMRASGELRKVLDAGEESLRILMNQLEQAVSLQAAKPAPEKKKMEPTKVELIRGTDKAS